MIKNNHNAKEKGGKRNKMNFTFWIPFIIIALIVIVVIYSILKPNPRLKESEHEISIPVVGKIWKTKQTYYQQELMKEKISDSSKIAYSQAAESIKNTNLKDIAFNKPVTYIGKQLFVQKEDGKLMIWDRDKCYEQYSVNAGSYESNLTDGDRNSCVYPASWFLDYVIDLKNTYDIKKIVLTWGSFGEKPEYITSWKIYGQKEFSNKNAPNIDSEWILIKSGNFPNSAVTSFDTNVNVRRFRIVAESVNADKGELLNWIGMSQFEAYAEIVE